MNDVIVKNPAKGVVLPKQEKYHHDTYDKDELKKLLICSANTSFEAPIMIEAFTGLRRGELLALKWEDIDFVTGNKGRTCTNGRPLVKSSARR